MAETLSSILTRAFDALLWPFGEHAALALAAVSLAFGVAAMLVFKATSDVARLRRTRDVFVARILEMRLYQDDAAVLLKAFGAALWSSVRHLGVNLRPLLALLPLVLVVVVQLDARFAHRPLGPGAAVLAVTLEKTGEALDDVWIVPGNGVIIETPAVRVPARREVLWRVRANPGGRRTVTLRAGGAAYDFELAVGAGTGVVGSRREASSLDPLMRPGLPRLPGGGPIARVAIDYPQPSYPLLWWRGGWLVVFVFWSLVGALAAKLVWRVEL